MFFVLNGSNNFLEFLFSPMLPPLTVRTAAAKAILVLTEERVTKRVTSSANVSIVNVVCNLMESSVKLVREAILLLKWYNFLSSDEIQEERGRAFGVAIPWIVWVNKGNQRQPWIKQSLLICAFCFHPNNSETLCREFVPFSLLFTYGDDFFLINTLLLLLWLLLLLLLLLLWLFWLKSFLTGKCFPDRTNYIKYFNFWEESLHKRYYNP